MKDLRIQELITRFSDTRENQEKAVFSTLFIAGNRLQTVFDNHIPEISLKQFMLLSIVRQLPEQLTFTQLGDILGCSRQNIKKLADALEKKGFITIQQSSSDAGAMCICPAKKAEEYFQEEFFRLLMRLYAGIENLQRSIREEERGK